MKHFILAITLLCLTTLAFAEEGKRGFVANYQVDGFFNPDIHSAVVITVDEGSNAEKAGIKIGDKIIAIEDCQIPGCAAKKAKKLMNRDKGEMVKITFEREDQSTFVVELVLE